MNNLTTILLSFSLLVSLLSSCNKNENNPSSSLEGTWLLVERLVDPGNGSGTFQPVTSSKTLVFATNGDISSNGNMCSMDIDTVNPSMGTYSTVDSTISPDICSFDLDFQLKAGNLLVYFPCIEPCILKYEKQP